MMPIATAPALLIGLGARIVLDFFSRSDGPFVKDYILIGTWQGVALHYAAKTSKNSRFGIIIAFGIAAKLFIEFNVVSDITRCITTILGVALGVLFTDFLSQYFDRPLSQSSDRRRKKNEPTKSPRKHEKTVQFRPSVQGGSVETLADVTDAGTLATGSHIFSDITSVESHSDNNGPTSSMSSEEREIYVLRTRASLADSERRRFKEERKWAISQGNLARASQMKWEVKRYTSLMQTFNREADLKVLEGMLRSALPPSKPVVIPALSIPASSSNKIGQQQQRGNEPEPSKSPSSNAKDKVIKAPREASPKANGTTTNGRPKTTHLRRTSSTKQLARDANG